MPEPEKILHEGKAYWEGSHGCLVPWHLESCTAKDGGNIRYRDGSQTEMGVSPQPSKREWLITHTIRDAKGRDIYRE